MKFLLGLYVFRRLACLCISVSLYLCVSVAFLLRSVSTNRANAEDSRNLAPARRLKAHSYFPFVLNQIRRDLVVNVEEVADSAAVWTSFDRLLTNMLAIDENLG